MQAQAGSEERNWSSANASERVKEQAIIACIPRRFYCHGRHNASVVYGL